MRVRIVTTTATAIAIPTIPPMGNPLNSPLVKSAPKNLKYFKFCTKEYLLINSLKYLFYLFFLDRNSLGIEAGLSDINYLWVNIKYTDI